MINYIMISDFEKTNIRISAIAGLEYTLNDLNLMLDQETNELNVIELEKLINDKILQIDAVRSIV
jgi:hypothetical protein